MVVNEKGEIVAGYHFLQLKYKYWNMPYPRTLCIRQVKSASSAKQLNKYANITFQTHSKPLNS